MQKTKAVLKEISEERKSQYFIYGEQDFTPEMFFTILGEKFGKVSTAIKEWRLEDKEGYKKNYREELIQLAAVAVQMVECLDRSEGSNAEEAEQ